MPIYPVLSALLDYPQQPLLDALDEIDGLLAAYPDTVRELAPLTYALRHRPLVELQEEYVATFDRNPRHSLHLFEHVHGESRERGQAMVDLLEEYRRHGLEMATNELPDYVPLFLEVLGVIAETDEVGAAALLGEAIHVLNAIGMQLRTEGNPYAGVFTALRYFSSVEAEPLTIAPVRDMDEALERFGVGADGVEPPVRPGATTTTPVTQPQPVAFYPRNVYAASMAARMNERAQEYANEGAKETR